MNFAHLLPANQAQIGDILEKRRRESSYTEALDDPLKYMELVKKTLGTQIEEDDKKKI